MRVLLSHFRDGFARSLTCAEIYINANCRPQTVIELFVTKEYIIMKFLVPPPIDNYLTLKTGAPGMASSTWIPQPVPAGALSIPLNPEGASSANLTY